MGTLGPCHFGGIDKSIEIDQLIQRAWLVKRTEREDIDIFTSNYDTVKPRKIKALEIYSVDIFTSFYVWCGIQQMGRSAFVVNGQGAQPA